MKKTSFRHIIVYLLLGLTALFIYTHETVAVPVNKPLEDIPSQFGEWTMENQTYFNAQMLAVLRPTDYLYRIYRDSEGNMVTLYLGYHAGGPESGAIHSPKHCLPGSGWFELSETKRSIPVENGEIPVVQAVYQNDDQKEMFLYYFQVKGRVLTNEYSLKLAEVTNSILYNRRDSAFIRISVPFTEDQSKAERVGKRFASSIYPHITSVLPL
ncbi:MAG: EpsI family protein [Desulfuromonadales bacterium]